ncbi:MAG: sugar-binding transcriptional regulator, partial [Pseudomonadota bacterium]
MEFSSDFWFGHMPEDVLSGRNNRVGADSNQQLRVRAVWLYYIEGLTQAEVANRLKVNRVAV